LFNTLSENKNYGNERRNKRKHLSSENKNYELRAFFEKHQCNPLERAEVYLTPHREFTKASGSKPATTQPSASSAASSNKPSPTHSEPSASSKPIHSEPSPLWGIDATVKAQLMEQLGGSRFTLGNQQEMGRDKIKPADLFDEPKQGRYDRFVDAIEGRVGVRGCMEVEGVANIRKKVSPHNWRPCQVICARFKVSDPWAKRLFVDDRSYKPEESSGVQKIIRPCETKTKLKASCADSNT